MPRASSASSARSTAARPRLGREEPRLFTPPLRPLTPETSLGFAAIEFAEGTLGWTLFPWQKWLLIHMLELLADGQLRFRTVVILVARQNGKSTLSIVLSLFFMYVLARDLVIGTAQDLDVAEEIWQAAVDVIDETPELLELKEKTSQTNGKKFVELATGEKYKVKAANRRAGRGLSGDLVLLDELREHQTWDAWGAITKTTIARAFALIVALSNAGDATSVVLRHLRRMAHLTLGDPDGIIAAEDPESQLADIPAEIEDAEGQEDDSLGLFEWSAPPGAGIWDRDAWAQANPSLGHTITERTLASAAKTDPEWVFRTECLCQWTDGSLEGPFPPGAYEATLDNGSRIVKGSPIYAWVDVAWNRQRASIAFAGRREDGLLHAEVVASRSGTDWVVDWLLPRVAEHRIVAIGLQASGAPVSSLLESMQVAGLPLFEAGGREMSASTALIYDLVRDKMIRRTAQPLLDLAAATAIMRRLSDGAWVWDRKKSLTEISGLVAWSGAAWLAQPKSMPEEPEPQVHAWDDEPSPSTDMVNDDEEQWW
ncbi:terminase large subunit domain-containing protein [Nocardia sp. NPDC058519]|uniref:terminase large subunit domain-containing protein n=1 Tax=Nocardia sp. NPDC058519 TaxID=3346535 RepID=UPI003669519F